MTDTTQNPLLEDGLTFPPVDRVTPAHFKQAFEKGFAQMQADFRAIRDSDEEPTFENTVLALSELDGGLEMAFDAFGQISLNKTSDAIVELGEWADIEHDKITKGFYQDQKMAARFKAVYDAKDSLGLDDEDVAVLDALYTDFESNGSFLSAAGQQRVNEIDSRLISLTTKYMDNARKAPQQQAVLFTTEDEVAGLSASDKTGMARQAADVAAALKPDATAEQKDAIAAVPEAILQELATRDDAGELEGCYLFYPERLAIDSMLEYAESRTFRRKIFEAMDKVGLEDPYDNTDLMKEIQQLRHERTMLLNEARPVDQKYQHYADYAQAQNGMFGSYDHVEKLIIDASGPLVEKLEEDMAVLQAFATSVGGPAVLEPYDVPYYTAQYKKDVLGFDAAAFTAYFPLENVKQGFFDHVEKLMGLTFKKAPDGLYPVVDPAVESYEVFDKDTGEMAGVFQFDLYARSGSKWGGAWMTALQKEDRENGLPQVVTFNMNMQKGDDAQLLDAEQVLTFFHEGGHDINALMSRTAKYKSGRETYTERDAAEIPSMIFERWAFEKDVLDNYAAHHETGARIPADLLQKKEDAEQFMASADALRMIQNCRWDFAFHTIDPSEYTDHLTLQKEALLDTPYAAHLRPYYMNRFDHLFSQGVGGYEAAYCGYFVADIHSQHGFSKFQQAGDLYDAALSEKIRTFYASSGASSATKAYESFAGEAADTGPWLESLGVKTADHDADHDPGHDANGPSPKSSPKPS